MKNRFKIKYDFLKNFKNFIMKYNITFNYCFLSIVFLLFFTFMLIKIIGNNILKHEAYILKKEFINKNIKFTQEIADKIGKYLENLDTLSIVDLIENIGKKEDVIYAYVLNDNGEVISHTVKSELFKKYPDKFLDKKYLRYFLKNIRKVWYKEREFKGKKIIKFSKPIILQFTKEDVLKELEIISSDESAIKTNAGITNMILSNTNATNKISATKKEDMISKKFYIAGVVHIAFSTEKLQLIQQFSKKRVRIYYYIAYILAIIFGFFIGKYIENSLNIANSTLVSILREESIEKINTQVRFDSFKNLFVTINQFLSRFEDVIASSEKEASVINKVYDLLLSKLCNNIEYGIICSIFAQ